MSSGIALLLWKSAQVIEGAQSADQAEELIRGLIRRERVSFLPDTLEYLRAGGRVSNAAYLGTSLLRLKVLINMVDGRLVASKKYRGDMEKVSFQYLEDFVKNLGGNRDAIILFYAEGFSLPLLERLKDRCRQMGFEQVLSTDIGCVISCHGGPGVMGAGRVCGRGVGNGRVDRRSRGLWTLLFIRLEPGVPQKRLDEAVFRRRQPAAGLGGTAADLIRLGVGATAVAGACGFVPGRIDSHAVLCPAL